MLHVRPLSNLSYVPRAVGVVSSWQPPCRRFFDSRVDKKGSIVPSYPNGFPAVKPSRFILP